MTAVSLINPYAPQPANTPAADANIPASHGAAPTNPSAAPTDAGVASDHSGQGAGNGTGTGGAQLAELLKRGRQDMQVQRATPESVVEAQSTGDPATRFLERQAREQADANAAEAARLAKRAAERAADAKAEAEKVAEPKFVMPDPLPTASFL
ncbi:MAG: hypothetical protein AAF999_02455 [Pseudomonadota bacterium]